ncbi:MAG: hypothetical protein K8E24_005520 [Methanobacterium paludis]|nr:hypothetical protein [Methanobacterium paludis]
MGLGVIEMDEDEQVFYNLGVFDKHEDLIVFPKSLLIVENMGKKVVKFSIQIYYVIYGFNEVNYVI